MQVENMRDQFEGVHCPLCENANYEVVYECYQETGYALGRI